MLRKHLYILLLSGFFTMEEGFSQTFQPIPKKQTIDCQSLTKNFMTWYTYTYNNIHLSGNFIALDKDSNSIDKSTFLQQLQTVTVFAFKIGSVEKQDVYRLYPLLSSDESIKATLQQMAATALQQYRMEGTTMPDFNFTDIIGKQYNSANTHGKILVLKCWFIACVACVKEFPELNKLVDHYKNNKNVLFISLAIDKTAPLLKFLQKKSFKYATVPEADTFMRDSLHITSYPTHLIIDANGKIRKVVNTVEELAPFLEEMAIKDKD